MQVVDNKEIAVITCCNLSAVPTYCCEKGKKYPTTPGRYLLNWREISVFNCTDLCYS